MCGLANICVQDTWKKEGDTFPELVIKLLAVFVKSKQEINFFYHLYQASESKPVYVGACCLPASCVQPCVEIERQCINEQLAFSAFILCCFIPQNMAAAKKSLPKFNNAQLIVLCHTSSYRRLSQLTARYARRSTPSAFLWALLMRARPFGCLAVAAWLHVVLYISYMYIVAYTTQLYVAAIF